MAALSRPKCSTLHSRLQQLGAVAYLAGRWAEPGSGDAIGRWCEWRVGPDARDPARPSPSPGSLAARTCSPCFEELEGGGRADGRREARHIRQHSRWSTPSFGLSAWLWDGPSSTALAASAATCWSQPRREKQAFKHGNGRTSLFPSFIH